MDQEYSAHHEVRHEETPRADESIPSAQPSNPLESTKAREVWLDRFTFSNVNDYDCIFGVFPTCCQVVVGPSAQSTRFYLGSLPLKSIYRNLGTHGSVPSAEEDTVIGAFTAPGFMVFLPRLHIKTFISSLKRHISPMSLTKQGGDIYSISSMLDGGGHTENIEVIKESMRSSGIPPRVWSGVFIGQIMRIPLAHFENTDPLDTHILHKANLQVDSDALSQNSFFNAVDKILKSAHQTEGSMHCLVTADFRVVSKSTENMVPIFSLNRDSHQYKGRQYAMSTSLHYFSHLAQCLKANKSSSWTSEYSRNNSPGSARIYYQQGNKMRGKMPLKNEAPPKRNALIKKKMSINCHFH